MDIKLEFTGMRPGEKLYEELLTADEGTTSTKHERIFVAKPGVVDVKRIEGLIQLIRERGSRLTRQEIVEELGGIVPGFSQGTGRMTGR